MLGLNDDRLWLTLVIFPAALLVAYAGSARSDSLTVGAGAVQGTAIIRDSAGVRIVESVRPAWPRGKEWRLASQPGVTIGAIEGEEHDVLSRVEGAVRLSDGSIAVGDGALVAYGSTTVLADT